MAGSSAGTGAGVGGAGVGGVGGGPDGGKRNCCGSGRKVDGLSSSLLVGAGSISGGKVLLRLLLDRLELAFLLDFPFELPFLLDLNDDEESLVFFPNLCRKALRLLGTRGSLVKLGSLFCPDPFEVSPMEFDIVGSGFLAFQREVLVTSDKTPKSSTKGFSSAKRSSGC